MKPSKESIRLFERIASLKTQARKNYDYAKEVLAWLESAILDMDVPNARKEWNFETDTFRIFIAPNGVKVISFTDKIAEHYEWKHTKRAIDDDAQTLLKYTLYEIIERLEPSQRQRRR